jgi:predicted transposase YdaD
MLDHDRLFKELLSTFFLDFLALFLPEVLTYLDPASLTFLEKEIFTDVTAGERHEADLIVQAQFRQRPSFFLIHVETQASNQSDFGQRMFRYFARLYEKYNTPVYPIVIFSYDRPKTPAPREFQVSFPDFSVLTFNYRVIQLNQLHWRDFLNQPNPVASALMAKMQIAPADRPKVKAECLRLLVTLKLDPARMQMISGFVDTYLKLTSDEETTFNLEIGHIESTNQEQVMEIVTSWMERGIEQGLEQGLKTGRQEGRQEGRREGEIRILLRLLTIMLGPLPAQTQAQIQGLTEPQLDQLSDRLPGYKALDDLTVWLNDTEKAEGFDAAKTQVLNLLRQHLGALTPNHKQQLLALSPHQWSALGEIALTLENTEALETWLTNNLET